MGRGLGEDLRCILESKGSWLSLKDLSSFQRRRNSFQSAMERPTEQTESINDNGCKFILLVGNLISFFFFLFA